MSVGLHRALSSDPKIKLGSFMAPSATHKQSEGETLQLLLVTHFPNSMVRENMAAPAAASNLWTDGWQRRLSQKSEMGN